MHSKKHCTVATQVARRKIFYNIFPVTILAQAKTANQARTTSRGRTVMPSCWPMVTINAMALAAPPRGGKTLDPSPPTSKTLKYRVSANSDIRHLTKEFAAACEKYETAHSVPEYLGTPKTTATAKAKVTAKTLKASLSTKIAVTSKVALPTKIAVTTKAVLSTETTEASEFDPVASYLSLSPFARSVYDQIVRDHTVCGEVIGNSHGFPVVNDYVFNTEGGYNHEHFVPVRELTNHEHCVPISVEAYNESYNELCIKQHRLFELRMNELLPRIHEVGSADVIC